MNKECVHLHEENVTSGVYNGGRFNSGGLGNLTIENGSSDVHIDDHHRTKRAAGGGSDCTPLSLEFEEIFYPLQIEFVLIGRCKPILPLEN